MVPPGEPSPGEEAESVWVLRDHVRAGPLETLVNNAGVRFTTQPVTAVLKFKTRLNSAGKAIMYWGLGIDPSGLWGVSLRKLIMN